MLRLLVAVLLTQFGTSTRCYNCLPLLHSLSLSFKAADFHPAARVLTRKAAVADSVTTRCPNSGDNTPLRHFRGTTRNSNRSFLSLSVSSCERSRRSGRHSDVCVFELGLSTEDDVVEAPPASVPVSASDSTEGDDVEDEFFDVRTTISLLGSQLALVPVAVIVATIAGTPNVGFGPNVSFDVSSLQYGMALVIPLFIFAAILEVFESRFVALQDVTKATQRSVLALLGGTWKPIVAFVVAIALGLAAGFGEEMMFRGIIQYELSSRYGIIVGLSTSGIIFALLHAVTPVYALLAGLASIYFGIVYQVTDNLAVPICAHAVYDFLALFYAHWIVCRLSLDEQLAIATWQGPASGTSSIKRDDDPP